MPSLILAFLYAAREPLRTPKPRFRYLEFSEPFQKLDTRAREVLPFGCAQCWRGIRLCALNMGARQGAGRKPNGAEVPHDPETGEIKADNVSLDCEPKRGCRLDLC